MAQATNVVTNFVHKHLHTNNLTQNLGNNTNKFLKRHDNILVLKADNGNVTVIMEKNEYIEKSLQQLNDKNITLN